MLKSKRASFQMQAKRFACQSVEFCEPSLTSHSIYVTFATCKFVLTVIHAVVIVAVQNYPVVRSPAVGTEY